MNQQKREKWRKEKGIFLTTFFIRVPRSVDTKQHGFGFLGRPLVAFFTEKGMEQT